MLERPLTALFAGLFDGVPAILCVQATAANSALILGLGDVDMCGVKFLADLFVFVSSA